MKTEERVALRHLIEDVIETWRDQLDDPPAWLHDPDKVKEAARDARDAVISHED